MKIYKLMLSLLVIMTFLVSCSDDNDKNDFGIFKVLDDTAIEMNGDITSKTLKNFNRLIEQYPDIKIINMNQVPGSTDDETNLKVAQRVYDLGIATHIMDGGEIASGGVDFFLAGVKRTRGNNTSIGVHSWEGDGKTAMDYPKGHEYHLPYINYYTSVGFTQQAAEDFYYFTINAAPASGIHWMTDEEIERYGILKE